MNFKKLIIGVFLSLSVISIGVLLFSFIKAIEPKENMKLLELIPKKTLDNIMDTYVEPISISPYNGGKPFCDYKIIDFKKDKNIIQIYLNLLSQEYYLNDGELIKGTGGTFLAVLTVKNIENNTFEFVNCDISRAAETSESLKIFPKYVRKKARENSQFNEESFHKIEDKAKIYYKLNKSI